MKTVIDINKSWLFRADEKNSRQVFSETATALPFFHAIASMPSGEFTSYWKPSEKEAGQAVYIEFSQISGEAEIFCNGKQVGTHKGFMSFTLPLVLDADVNTDYEITVRVTPADRGDGLFCFAGAKIITAGSSHFAVADNGRGLYISPALNENDGEITIEAQVVRPNNYDVVTYTVLNMTGDELLTVTAKPTSPSIVINIPSPELWDGQNGAYLYTLKARLLRDSEVLDEISSTFGFREFSFGADGFFRLNGFNLPLNGIKLNDLHSVKSDLRNILRLDCNALISGLLPSRTDLPAFCSREGILLWYMLPFTGNIQDDTALLREFLLLYRNEPSLAFIVLSSEADIPYFEEAKKITLQLAPTVICVPSADIDSAKDKLIPSATLTVLELSADDSPEAYISFNGRFLELQEKYPDKFFAVYAKSPEKAIISPEKYLDRQIRLWQSFSRQKNVAAYFPGILADGQETASLRGLSASSRTELYDAFWFCKSQFSSEGFIKIAQPEEYETSAKTIDIKCITNRSNIRALINGKDKKYKAEKLSDGIYVFRGIKLRRDENTIEVSADDECDSITIFRL